MRTVVSSQCKPIDLTFLFIYTVIISDNADAILLQYPPKYKAPLFLSPHPSALRPPPSATSAAATS